MPTFAHDTAPAPLQAVPPTSREGLYFRLVVRGLGHEPSNFRFRRFFQRSSERFKVGVFGRGSGAVYDADESESWTSQFADDLRNGHFNAERPPALGKDKLTVLRQVIAAFEKTGFDGGLQILNERVPHRFTAMYRLDAGMMRNVSLVDKERSPDTFSLQAVPLEESFCQFALRDGFFLTTRSGSDERLADHPYSGVVGSYVGVPIASGENKLYGTLCHFDLGERQIADDEFFLMQHVALFLPRRLQA
jgi:GAF domain-containing protein